VSETHIRNRNILCCKSCPYPSTCNFPELIDGLVIYSSLNRIHQMFRRTRRSPFCVYRRYSFIRIIHNLEGYRSQASLNISGLFWRIPGRNHIGHVTKLPDDIICIKVTTCHDGICGRLARFLHLLHQAEQSGIRLLLISGKLIPEIYYRSSLLLGDNGIISKTLDRWICCHIAVQPVGKDCMPDRCISRKDGEILRWHSN